MTPKTTVLKWVEAFNKADIDELAALYHNEAINHQVYTDPLVGKAAIKAFLSNEFAMATMVCVIENIFEDGDWAILEWSDPLGLRGCGFFKIEEGKIIFQRGYFDRLSFLRQQKLPIPTE
jgi:limonene-1,2-epoxide hydrolase